MKKLVVPVLLVLFAVGMSQREAKAGFSIGISIGDSHRHSAPVVVAPAPEVVISRPPVVVAAPAPVVCEPAPPVCEPAPVVVVSPGYRYPHYPRYERWDHHRDYHRDYHGDYRHVEYRRETARPGGHR